MTNRRDFFKFFAAGTTIVPILGGVPVEEGRALIVEPPRVEPVQSFLSTSKVPEIGNYRVTVYAQNKATKQSFTIESDAFLSHVVTEHVDVTGYGDTFHRQIPGPSRMTFEVTGVPYVRIAAIYRSTIGS